jgi:Mor family transcriptional regulator
MKDITIEDMPTPDMETVAKVCGVEMAVLLMSRFSGAQFYIPRFWYRNLVERKIIAEYDGRNANLLARKFGVSRQHVYRVLQRDASERKIRKSTR